MNLSAREVLAAEDRRAGDLRWTLLLALVEGLKCVRPEQYQADCGKCGVCMCRYRHGSLHLEGRERLVPGAFEMRDLSDDVWADLLLARENRSRRA